MYTYRLFVLCLSSLDVIDVSLPFFQKDWSFLQIKLFCSEFYYPGTRLMFNYVT